ncbi:MAG: asparagine synthase-related protein [Gemmatimonadota bacterium]
MSGILAWAGPALEPDRFRRALERLTARGADRREDVDAGGAWLGATRPDWQAAADLAGPTLIDRIGDVRVVADATLYYTDDLRTALGDAPAGPRAESAGTLVARAWTRWGVAGTGRLEGDFAFALWDGSTRTLVAARDFAGFRPLFWAPIGPGVAVASSAGALRALGADDSLDLAVLAAVSAGLHRAAGPETVFRGIRMVPAGHTLVWRDGEVRVEPHWSPPRWERGATLPFDEAAAHLRGLIARAAEERLAAAGPTSFPLSGGWDSTVLYAIAADALGRRPGSPQPRPVSISYPEGDPGREDEIILRTLAHRDASTRWIDVDSVALFDDLETRIAGQDLPFVHFYEHWNRALARAARADGARVQFSGYGGDQLFQVSNVYVSELVRRGRLLEAWREWQRKGERSRKEFVRMGVLPLLPGWAHDALTRVRAGRPLHRYLERWIPRWIDPGFARAQDLRGREEERLPSAYPGTPAEQEWRWFVLDPFFPLVASRVADFALDEGVEARAPLYDRRIVEFSATRPWTDLSLGAETKRLLRASARGLVPDDVLAPRAHRTGTTGAYAERQVRAAFPALVPRLFEGPLLLADLGIIRADSLRAVCRPFLDGRGFPNTMEVMALFYTLQTELWLRAQAGEASA